MTNRLIRIAIPLGLVGAAMTGYFHFNSTVSAHALAENLEAFTKDANRVWKAISEKSGIEMRRTSKGDLQPIIHEMFGALDLIIYGDQIVNSEFKAKFSELNIPTLENRVVFGNHLDGSLEYSISGIKVVNYQVTSDLTHGVVYFDKVTKLVAEEIDDYIDGGDGAKKGLVRYKKTGLNYFLGIFSPYEETPSQPL